MYVLAKVDGIVGFYIADGTIAAGKAYYQSTSGAKAFFFNGDDATGISNVEVKDFSQSLKLINRRRECL